MEAVTIYPLLSMLFLYVLSSYANAFLTIKPAIATLLLWLV